MSSLINSMSNLARRIGSMLGIISTPADTTNDNPVRNQSIEVINSGSQSVPFPPKPDGWQSPESWIRFQELRVKYPRNFQDADTYINSFTPGEVEMIMEWVGEESCLMFTDMTHTDMTHTDMTNKECIGDIHLFKRIAETRQTQEPAILEYIKLSYALDSMPPQNHYEYKFVGNDTIYDC